MKIQKVTNTKSLNEFIKFADKLYKDDKFYVPYMRADLKRTLTKLVLVDGSYTALIALDDKNKMHGRVLYTVEKHKQYGNEPCGFFAMFECVDDQRVANLMLDAMCDDLRKRGVSRIEGTYMPYDQDNRRGILVEGFDSSPVLMTSYNKPYYKFLLENYGMSKDFDMFAYAMTKQTMPVERYRKVAQYSEKRYDYYVENADFNNIDKLIDEVGEVMKAATTEDIFQDAPSIEALRTIVTEWKNYLREDLCFFARRKSDDKMIGVIIAVPDFNQLFRRMKGKINLISLCKMLYYKNKITTVRGLLQYVLPEYQNKGTVLSLYIALFDACDKMGVTLIEASTMMEKNVKPNEAIKSAGGVLYKRYRLYGMNLTE